MHASLGRTPVWMYAAFTVPPTIVLAIVFAQPFVDPSLLLRDPAALVAYVGVPDHIPIYYGFVSNLGILIWTAAASLCLFTGLFLTASDMDRANGAFMIASGLLTSILVLDDFFMIHEVVFRYVTGLDPSFLVGIYGVLALIYLARFAGAIIAHHSGLLILALAAFGTSVFLDFLEDMGAEHSSLALEDGAKLVGIFGWLGFYVTAAWRLLSSPRGAA